MRGISVKALLVGSALGFALDLVLGAALVLLFSQGALASGASASDAEKALAAIVQKPGFQAASLVLGALTTVVAAYTGALVAKRLPYMNAAAVGAVGIVVGAFLADGSSPAWYNVLAFGSVLPCALFGGHIAKRRQRAGA